MMPQAEHPPQLLPPQPADEQNLGLVFSSKMETAEIPRSDYRDSPGTRIKAEREPLYKMGKQTLISERFACGV